MIKTIEAARMLVSGDPDTFEVITTQLDDNFHILKEGKLNPEAISEHLSLLCFALIDLGIRAGDREDELKRLWARVGKLEGIVETMLNKSMSIDSRLKILELKEQEKERDEVEVDHREY